MTQTAKTKTAGDCCFLHIDPSFGNVIWHRTLSNTGSRNAQLQKTIQRLRFVGTTPPSLSVLHSYPHEVIITHGRPTHSNTTTAVATAHKHMARINEPVHVHFDL